MHRRQHVVLLVTALVAVATTYLPVMVSLYRGDSAPCIVWFRIADLPLGRGAHVIAAVAAVRALLALGGPAAPLPMATVGRTPARRSRLAAWLRRSRGSLLLQGSLTTAYVVAGFEVGLVPSAITLDGPGAIPVSLAHLVLLVVLVGQARHPAE